MQISQNNLSNLDSIMDQQQEVQTQHQEAQTQPIQLSQDQVKNQ